MAQLRTVIINKLDAKIRENANLIKVLFLHIDSPAFNVDDEQAVFHVEQAGKMLAKQICQWAEAGENIDFLSQPELIQLAQEVGAL